MRAGGKGRGTEESDCQRAIGPRGPAEAVRRRRPIVREYGARSADRLGDGAALGGRAAGPLVDRAGASRLVLGVARTPAVAFGSRSAHLGCPPYPSQLIQLSKL